MTDINEIRRVASVQRELIVGVRQKCIDLKKLSVFLQPVEARKIAPEIDEALFQAYRTIDYLVYELGKLELNNRVEKQHIEGRAPGQFTDRVVNIQGREGFRWQVTL